MTRAWRGLASWRFNFPGREAIQLQRHAHHAPRRAAAHRRAAMRTPGPCPCTAIIIPGGDRTMIFPAHFHGQGCERIDKVLRASAQTMRTYRASVRLPPRSSFGCRQLHLLRYLPRARFHARAHA